jgi:hypothetical protein
MRPLLLSLSTLLVLSAGGCGRRVPPPAVPTELTESEPVRCQVVEAVLREQLQREGRALEVTTEESVEPVQVFLRAGAGLVLERFFAEEPSCQVGRFRVVQAAENEAITLLLTPTAGGFAWEVHRGQGPVVPEQPQPMGRILHDGAQWVSSTD